MSKPLETWYLTNLVLLLYALGYVGGGQPTFGGTPITTQTGTIGPSQGSLSAPTYGMGWSIAPGSLLSFQNITLAIYPGSVYPISDLTSGGDNPFSICLNRAQFVGKGSLSVTIPLGGITDTVGLSIALSSVHGFGLPLDATMNSRLGPSLLQPRKRISITWRRKTHHWAVSSPVGPTKVIAKLRSRKIT